MARTPARSSSFLSVHETPCVFQSTPISVASPESGYYDGNSTNRSSNFSPSSALLSEDDSRCGSSMASYSRDPVPQLLRFKARERRPHVDILKKLQSCTPAICKILSYLPTPDLVRACHVSAEWRRLCLSIPEQARRFWTYVEEREERYESSRENIQEHRPPKREPSSAAPLTAHNAKAEQNSNGQAGKNEETKTRLDLFTEEAKHIRKDEWLLPCPNCQYPSRVTDNGTTGTCKCGYRFCPNCRRDYHLPEPCVTHSDRVPPKSKKNVIGSKYSRSQLRRL